MNPEENKTESSEEKEDAPEESQSSLSFTVYVNVSKQVEEALIRVLEALRYRITVTK